jgi:hypothetical protein
VPTGDGRVTVAVAAGPELPGAYSRRPARWFLVRPDGHIAAARDASATQDVRAALRRAAHALPQSADLG